MYEPDTNNAGSPITAQSETVPLREEDLHEDSSTSESEYQHALEVIFDGEVLHRRRSSLNESEGSKMVRQKIQKRTDTACFVHQLIEKERKAKKSAALNGLNDIAENIKMDNAGEVSTEKLTHSRLLTKKQLSDMTWGVRELSKKLGSLRLRLKVKTIFILTKAHDEDLISYTREVTEWLLAKDRQIPLIVYVQDTLEHNHRFDSKGLISKDPSYEGRLKYWTNDLCQKSPHTFDLAISLGGDGTVLYASWLFQRVVPPVLSFALGSLGFLTKFDFKDYQETLSTSFNEGVTVSLRLRFEGTVMRSQKSGDNDSKRDLVEDLVGEECDNNHTHKPDGSHNILNEIVVDRGPNPSTYIVPYDEHTKLKLLAMSSIEVFGDDEHFTTVQADGVCVATPTGSTAYNLAAGGSLCHPENPVILVSAICAHTLSFRPIILPDTIVLRIGVPYDARTSSWASFDGRERYPFANVMPQGRRSEDWVNSISRTLQWNSRQRQKSFKEWQKQ
ncbi:hypothetical protein MMC13_003452 [Lambiella insularis]|nr:hypothetical protein [Lambiella insularis]